MGASSSSFTKEEMAKKLTYKPVSPASQRVQEPLYRHLHAYYCYYVPLQPPGEVHLRSSSSRRSEVASCSKVPSTVEMGMHKELCQGLLYGH